MAADFVNKTVPIRDRLLGEAQHMPVQPPLKIPAAALGAAPPLRVDLTLGDDLTIEEADFLPTTEDVAELLDQAMVDPSSADAMLNCPLFLAAVEPIQPLEVSGGGASHFALFQS